jgi:ubiquinone/menaquinone biosynthesis C-methylase UbiE
MLDQVRQRLSGRSFEARPGDVESLPVDDSHADAVLANMVLHHAPDPARAIQEMVRVLKPGGTLVITDADAHTHEWLLTEQHDRWLGFEREEVASWFRAAGLNQVSVSDTKEICSPSSQCGTKAAITIFLARGRKP